MSEHPPVRRVWASKTTIVDVDGYQLQPYLYWSGSPGSNSPNSFATFSFNSGFQGANTAQNFLYVLPMIPHAISGMHAGDATTVFDPKTSITWLADGNLAAAETFGIP